MGGSPIHNIMSKSGLPLNIKLYNYASTLTVKDQAYRATVTNAELSQPLSRDGHSTLEHLSIPFDYSKHTIGLIHSLIPIDYWLTNLINLITKYVTRLVIQINLVGY